MLTRRILWLVALALAPALAIQGYNEMVLRAAREEAVRTDVMRTAADAADDLAGIAETVREGLAFVSKEDAMAASGARQTVPIDSRLLSAMRSGRSSRPL